MSVIKCGALMELVKEGWKYKKKRQKQNRALLKKIKKENSETLQIKEKILKKTNKNKKKAS